MERYADAIAGSLSAEGREWVTRGARLLIRFGALLFLAYALSTAVLQMDMYYITLAALAIVSAIILSYRFEFGLLLYFFAAPFNRGHSPAVLGAAASYDAGVMPSQVGLILLLAFWAAAQVFNNRQKLVSTRLNRPVIAFFGVAVVSTILAYYIWDPKVQRYDKQLLYHISEIGLWVLCVLAFYLVANGAKRKEWIAALFWPVVLVGLYVSCFQIAGLDLPFKIGRSAFMVAFAATLTSARLMTGKEGGAAKVFFTLLLGLFIVAAFWNRMWVSGWLSTSLGILFVTLQYSRRIFIGIVLVALFALFIYPGFYHSVYSESRQEGDMDRLTIWGDAVNMAVKVNPLFGIGPADYLTYARRYSSIWYGQTTYTTAHSDYAQVIAELGLLGIVTFLWLITAGIRTGIDAVRSCPKKYKWFAIGSTAVFTSVVVTSLVGDYIFPSRVNGGIWSFGTSVFPWLLLGAAVALSQPDKETQEDAV